MIDLIIVPAFLILSVGIILDIAGKGFDKASNGEKIALFLSVLFAIGWIIF